jgi:RimJ/RimL family protein N-acetyltransferase
VTPEDRTTAAVVIRPVTPADLGALDLLMSNLDTQARYRRWFTGAADVHRAAAWAAHPEEQDAVGLVAAAPDGELVGHAALVPIDEASAEVAFEVAAPWRQHGIAGRLLDELDRRAAARGFTTLVAEVLAENADMLAVMREHGPCRERLEGGVVRLDLPVGTRTPGRADKR